MPSLHTMTPYTAYRRKLLTLARRSPMYSKVRDAAYTAAYQLRQAELGHDSEPLRCGLVDNLMILKAAR